jgi:peptidoglycan/xylan/chitin deacetylase (PgdA/CDA1 family)
MIMLLYAALGTAAVVAAYVLWRARLGYPPADLPSVIAYHKVTRFEFGGTWVPPGRFSAQLDLLSDAGYRFIDEDTFLRTVEGTRTGSSCELLLTFDDGYRELLDHAVPALARRRIPALLFIVSAFVGRENSWELPLPGRRSVHLDWDELADLRRSGFAIGSHAATHRDLTRLGPDALRAELAESKSILDDRLGCRVRSLSYPFGRTNARVAAAAKRAGYRAAFSMYPRIPNAVVDRYALRRSGVYIIDTKRSLTAKFSRGPLFWLEDVKGRAINAVAVLTPLLRRNRVPTE